MRTIGDAIGETSKAADAERRLRADLDAVRSRVAGKPPVRTLIARTQTGLDVVGGGNFMDELLTIAGGTNVLGGGGDNSFPSIDREMLVTLNPDVVLQLLPGATPQEVEHAHRFWPTVPQVSAVRGGRVHVLTEPYLLLPGASVSKIANLFADRLHPDSAHPTTSRGGT
jgi:iron complex transport system substrate-binding protein